MKNEKSVQINMFYFKLELYNNKKYINTVYLNFKLIFNIV